VATRVYSQTKELEGDVRSLKVAGAILGTAALCTTAVLACGDHLLVIGRGVRFQHAYAQHRGNLLIYATRSEGGATLKNARLQATLKKVGHKLQTVEGASQLDEVLKSEKVDVVLADFADLAAISRELQSAPSKPVILPILFKPSKAELAAAQREYRFTLKAPADEVQYLTAIDEAMKSRSKITAKT
jgi:hypothetical protein